MNRTRSRGNKEHQHPQYTTPASVSDATHPSPVAHHALLLPGLEASSALGLPLGHFHSFIPTPSPNGKRRRCNWEAEREGCCEPATMRHGGGQGHNEARSRGGGGVAACRCAAWLLRGPTTVAVVRRGPKTETWLYSEGSVFLVETEKPK